MSWPARHSDACMFGYGPYPCTCSRGIPPVRLELADDLGEHAGGQLRIGAPGDQLELLPLEDSAIPADASANPTPAELEQLRRQQHERSTTL